MVLHFNMWRKQKLFGLIAALLLQPLAGLSAVGIYNWSAQTSEGGTAPVTISYRLNTAAEVAVEILDSSNQTVRTLGPFSAGKGLNQAVWDGSGATGGGLYRAKITAVAEPVGASQGQLVKLSGENYVSSGFYGLAVDNNPESPGYGTVYVTFAGGGKSLMAYYPDGEMKWEIKNVFSPDKAPWGVGVDRQGYIYTASKQNGVASGIKIFSPDGTIVGEMQPGVGQNNNWFGGYIDGGTPFAVKSDDSGGLFFLPLSPDRSSATGEWSQTIAPPVADARLMQFAFSDDGQACYLAYHRKSNTITNPENRGVFRYVKNSSGNWVLDAGFDPLLRQFPLPLGASAADLAAGIGIGPGVLWIGIDYPNGGVEGNVKRLRLSDMQVDSFIGPSKVGRFMAPDAVGNVAMDHDVNYNLDDKWRGWGIFAPADNGSSDERITEGFTLNMGGNSAPQVTSLALSPEIIARDGEDASILSALVKDIDGEADIESVTIDLTSIGGGVRELTQYISLGDGLTREYSCAITAGIGAQIGTAVLPITVKDKGMLEGNGSVNIVVAEVFSSISEAKAKPNGHPAAFSGEKIVSAVFADCFYVVDNGGVCGIKIISGMLPELGSQIKVKGIVGLVDGERVLSPAVVLP